MGSLPEPLAAAAAAEHGIDEPPPAVVGVLPKDRPAVVISVFDSPDPPGLWQEITGPICSRRPFITGGGGCSSASSSPPLPRRALDAFGVVFPILRWGRSYNLTMLRGDFMAGLTLASLSIPQSIGYANLAKLDPQYGLYTSVVPPLIYAAMGTSREIAIGPVAVVSLLLSSMVQRLVDPQLDPELYRKLVFTATFFAGIFQVLFGLLRLGFLVDFLSHATVVGFMAGAAIVIGLQQAKSLLGLSTFTNKTDVVSVARAIVTAVHDTWHPYNFLIGCIFLIFILLARFQARRKRNLFWIAAVAPLLSVVLSTLLVFLTRADKHGVKTIQHVKGGLNPSSAKELQFSGGFAGETAKIGLVCSLIALAEAVAVGRSFATINGYQLDGNKEMVAMGVMNVAGSMSSCYVATGSFSRTAVNFSAGCKSPASNIVMAVAVFVALQLLTKLLYYTPISILASVVLSALPGLIDLREVYNIWEVDKMDFLACTGAFFGVLFGSVEIGLLTAIVFSLARVTLSSIWPRIEELGRIEGTEAFCSVRQYPPAEKPPGVLVARIDSSFLCFMNAHYIREKIVARASPPAPGERDPASEENADDERTRSVVVDMSNVRNIDTAGIAAMGELRSRLAAIDVQLAIANPMWNVIHKMKVDGVADRIGEDWIFLTVGEAVESCMSTAKTVNGGCAK